jgi:hypothetical protein
VVPLGACETSREVLYFGDSILARDAVI